ncbi:MAG: SDR family NAD(P)-dependent oxidoreductase [Gloeomargaritaceae cyanobacterium C42_A2020_066]|nr:SDR family NAD(P)-dependent oxidoreductase [Gloeomargaritaceae cyanobacterium C42_A2020_066]
MGQSRRLARRKVNVFQSLMSIHWVMAACFLILFVVGIPMVRLPEALGVRGLAYSTHKSFGVLVLILLVARMVLLIQASWKRYARRSPRLSLPWLGSVALHSFLYYGAAGGQATYAIGDLATDVGADAADEGAGNIDILVNNAGIYPGKDWFQETAEDWNLVHNVNVASMVRMNNRLVPGMVARGGGRVITVASGVASKPQTGMPSYSASKMANLNLAVSLAHALAGMGVTSNAGSPGIIMTEGVDAMFG